MMSNSEKNNLIGPTTVDTLNNITAVIMLLENLKFDSRLETPDEHGLLMIHSLIKDSLHYEVDRIENPVEEQL